MGASVLVLGAGDLGARAASFLARSGALGRLVVTRRSADDACRLANSLLLHADLLGHRLETAGVGLDVTEVEATAELLQDLRPDLVLSCAIVERWWLGDNLPPPRRRHFYGAHMAGWLPVALLAPLRVMQAVSGALPGVPVINAAFPDLVHAVLGERGLAPTAGLGNVDLVRFRLAHAAAQLLEVSPSRIGLSLVAHHYHFTLLNQAAWPEVLPLLELRLDGRPVAEADLPFERLWWRAAEAMIVPTRRGTNDMAAASAVRTVLALLGETAVPLHVPGPQGLPGGYPVRAAGGRIDLDLPPGISRADAIAVNRRAQELSGIARIEPGGDVVLSEHAAAELRQALDWDLPRIAFDDIEAVALELIARVRGLADSG